MTVLVAGWFSFPEMGASAGDLLCRDLVVDWLRDHQIVVDVSVARPFDTASVPGARASVNWETANPSDYDIVVFVCGPFGNGWPITEFLPRFAGRRLVGINLTMLQDLREWNPFDVLSERDSSRATNPDLVFLSPPARTPVAGLILVHEQKEYGPRGLHEQANRALSAVAASRAAAVVPIDTRLDKNLTGFTTPAQVDSVISRMDVVLTTRLHGMVLALRQGIAPVVIDPIAGGAKVIRQAETLEWPHVFRSDRLDEAALAHAFDECCSPAGRALALACAARARQTLLQVKNGFVSAVAGAMAAHSERG